MVLGLNEKCDECGKYGFCGCDYSTKVKDDCSDCDCCDCDHYCACDRVKDRLEECGEIVVKDDAGDWYELHQHDVDFNGCWVSLDHDEEKHDYDLHSVVKIEVHESGDLDR